MSRKHRTNFVLLLFTVCIAITWSTAIARADRPGEAPSAGSICDILSDATPGLEPLCVNYCEVRDCPNSDASECDNLLANYDRRRADSDPGMPCLATCPCFTEQEMSNHSFDLTACIRESSDTFRFTAIFDDTTVWGAAASRRLDLGIYDCGFSDVIDGQNVIRFGGFSLAPEEAAKCGAIIESEIAARSLICDPLF